MADVKISGLPASTTPLAGTEVLPIVQGGQTRQVSIANVTAGRPISASTVQATTTVGVGAATPAASGAGITFPATQSASTDVNTLDDYEEGTFDASYQTSGTNFVTVTYQTRSFKYVKIGSTVFIQGNISTNNVDATGATGTLQLAGLPFPVAAASAGNNGRGVASVIGASFAATPPQVARFDQGTSTMTLWQAASGTGAAICPITTLVTGAVGSQNNCTLAGTYITT